MHPEAERNLKDLQYRRMVSGGIWQEVHPTMAKYRRAGYRMERTSRPANISMFNRFAKHQHTTNGMAYHVGRKLTDRSKATWRPIRVRWRGEPQIMLDEALNELVFMYGHLPDIEFVIISNDRGNLTQFRLHNFDREGKRLEHERLGDAEEART